MCGQLFPFHARTLFRGYRMRLSGSRKQAEVVVKIKKQKEKSKGKG
jgi:hypothetical protein